MRWVFISSLVLTACVEGEPDNPFGAGRLQAKPDFLVAGETWPAALEDGWEAPTPERIFYVAPGGDDEAFGGSDEPWGSLQTSLCRLRAGDRLVLRAGEYTGPFFIDDECASVPANKSIEVVGEPGAKLVGGPSAIAKGFWDPVLLLNRAGWILRGFQIEPSASEGVGLQVLEGGARAVLRDLVIFESGSAGVTLGPKLNGASLRNLVVRHTTGAQGGYGHVVTVLGGCQAISITASFIHHNKGDGIHLLGAHVLPFSLGAVTGVTATRDFQILGNEIHDNTGHGVVIGHSAGTVIKANRVWNVRPSPIGQGIAIQLHDGAQDVVVEGNLIAEVTEGLVVAAGDRLEIHPDGARAPQSVLIERNLIHNPLTPGRYGVYIDTATAVRVYHNVVHRTRKALQVLDLPPKTAGLRVLNNLFLDASELGFRVSGLNVFDRFDFNAFSLGGTPVQSEIGDARQSVASLIEEGQITNSLAVGAAGFESGDLANPNGVQVVDKGTPIPGFSYEGAAPDLGLFEHPAAQ